MKWYIRTVISLLILVGLYHLVMGRSCDSAALYSLSALLYIAFKEEIED